MHHRRALFLGIFALLPLAAACGPGWAPADAGPDATTPAPDAEALRALRGQHHVPVAELLRARAPQGPEGLPGPVQRARRVPAGPAGSTPLRPVCSSNESLCLLGCTGLASDVCLEGQVCTPLGIESRLQVTVASPALSIAPMLVAWRRQNVQGPPETHPKRAAPRTTTPSSSGPTRARTRRQEQQAAPDPLATSAPPAATRCAPALPDDRTRDLLDGAAPEDVHGQPARFDRMRAVPWESSDGPKETLENWRERRHLEELQRLFGGGTFHVAVYAEGRGGIVMTSFPLELPGPVKARPASRRAEVQHGLTAVTTDAGTLLGDWTSSTLHEPRRPARLGPVAARYAPGSRARRYHPESLTFYRETQSRQLTIDIATAAQQSTTAAIETVKEVAPQDRRPLSAGAARGRGRRDSAARAAAKLFVEMLEVFAQGQKRGRRSSISCATTSPTPSRTPRATVAQALMQWASILTGRGLHDAPAALKKIREILKSGEQGRRRAPGRGTLRKERAKATSWRKPRIRRAPCAAAGRRLGCSSPYRKAPPSSTGNPGDRAANRRRSSARWRSDARPHGGPARRGPSRRAARGDVRRTRRGPAHTSVLSSRLRELAVLTTPVLENGSLHRRAPREGQQHLLRLHRPMPSMTRSSLAAWKSNTAESPP